MMAHRIQFKIPVPLCNLLLMVNKLKCIQNLYIISVSLDPLLLPQYELM